MKHTNHRQGPRPRPLKEHTFTVENDDTLLTFLLAQLPAKGRNALKAALRCHQVFVDDVPVSQFDHALVPGAQVKVCWGKEMQQQTALVDVKIVYEDAELVVIDKPAGLLTIATEAEKRKTAYSLLSDYVKRADSRNKIFIVHRLDRDTSGLLLFAKNSRVKQQLQATWETTVNQRTYVGVVEGVVEKTEGTIISWLAETTAFRVYSLANGQGGKKAITHYRKIGGNSRYSLLQLNLDTGRKHQIRVHMQDMGHPIVGDNRYGAPSNPMQRMALHAQVLAFTHPTTGEALRFETPIPQRFVQITATRTGESAR